MSDTYLQKMTTSTSVKCCGRMCFRRELKAVTVAIVAHLMEHFPGSMIKRTPPTNEQKHDYADQPPVSNVDPRIFHLWPHEH